MTNTLTQLIQNPKIASAFAFIENHGEVQETENLLSEFYDLNYQNRLNRNLAQYNLVIEENKKEKEGKIPHNLIDILDKFDGEKTLHIYNSDDLIYENVRNALEWKPKDPKGKLNTFLVAGGIATYFLGAYTGCFALIAASEKKIGYSLGISLLSLAGIGLYTVIKSANNSDRNIEKADKEKPQEIIRRQKAFYSLQNRSRNLDEAIELYNKLTEDK